MIVNPHRVALITHDLKGAGGSSTMLGFLYRVLTESGLYQPDVISLATSTSDSASVRLLKPSSWWHGPAVETREWRNIPYLHVGAVATEIEFQRYRPRAVLDRLLNEYDLIQFVVGVPAWAGVAQRVNRPVVLWTATTVLADRSSRLNAAPQPRRAWQKMMTHFARRYERLGLQTADQVLALSNYTMQSVLNLCPIDHISVAVCGVDTAVFTPGPDRGNYILAVGRLSDARKNVRLLLQAYAQFLRECKSVPDLYLVGDLPTAAALQYVSQLGIRAHVQFLGPKHGAELAEVYRQARCFVLSSDEEGLGIVILEAMASGLPVVSTDCGGPATAIVAGETGVLTPVGDADALAQAMQSLWEQPALRRQMGQAGRQRAVERFSIEATGRIFQEKYDELIARRF